MTRNTPTQHAQTADGTTERPTLDRTPLLRRSTAQVVSALLEGPKSGSLELQLAATTGLSVEKVHDRVNELALLGFVSHEDSAAGYLVRLNPNSEQLRALRSLIEAGGDRPAKRNLAERLAGVGAGLNVAMLWDGKLELAPLIVATMSDETRRDQLDATRNEIYQAVVPLLPVRPDIWVFEWSRYQEAYADGEPALQRMWRKGIQLAGGDPMTQAAAIEAASERIGRIVAQSTRR
jgi:hypothetical protein